MSTFTRYARNPILKPNPFHPWEALNVFNAGVTFYNGLFHMLYRAQGVDFISTLGYAVSTDGFTWSRLDEPVLIPANEFETRGVEDPRITYLEDRFLMTFTAYSPIGVRVSLASSTNLVSWERQGIILPDEDNKDAAILPEKINGRYCLLHRREPDIWIAYSHDLQHWTDHQVLMRPIPGGWQHKKIGIAGTPVKIEAGWLMIYHAVDSQNVYRLGAAVLDGNDPSTIKFRLDKPILEPEEPWELKGDVPNVVFSCGHVIKEGTIYVFYGGADRVMAVATSPLKKMMEGLTGSIST